MQKCYLDTETCGLFGFPVILQYSFNNDEEITIYEIWKEPVYKTLNLIEKIVDGVMVGFNLAFDHFMLCKTYTTWKLLPQDWIPQQHIEEIAIKEKEARDGPCLKPKSAMDIMLYARRTKYQSTMKREPIRIKKVPVELVFILQRELENRIKFPSIYFAKRKDKFRPTWELHDCFDEDDNLDPRFKDIVCSFDASTALKALVADALNIEVAKFGDISLPKEYNPVELGYAPYALAIGTPKNWNGAWPSVINSHIRHWHKDEYARKYASDDVRYLRLLEKYFQIDEEDYGDDNSVLACMVASCRWRGYSVDLNKIRNLKEQAKKKITIDTYHERVKKYLEEVLSPTEIVSLKDKNNEKIGTGKIVLEKIAKFTIACKNCLGTGEIQIGKCSRCSGKGEIVSEAGKRAQIVLDSREAEKEIQLYDKLLVTDRLHADFVVIGTLSSRMSGAGGLNTQGIKAEKKVREAFTLANEGYILSGGDFEAFEIVLALAAYNDPDLLRDVTTPRQCHVCLGTKVTNICKECKDKESNGDCIFCNGSGILHVSRTCYLCDGKGEIDTKIHALFGTFIFPEKTYSEILDSKGSSNDLYTKSKSGLFSQLYGGTEHTLADRLGVPIEVALAGNQRFEQRYKQIKVHRQKIIDMFCSMKQPMGIGTKVVWNEPADYVEEPVTGHRRYYTLENKIAKALFELAEDPTENLKKAGGTFKVIRRDRVQTGIGAVRSSLFAAAFSLQASNMRSAGNHYIQSSGAVICKRLQRMIWNLQPPGISQFVVQPINIHDEILCPTLPDCINDVQDVVNQTVNYFKKQVPLLAIDWKQSIANWGEK